jgi:hypothetical protein
MKTLLRSAAVASALLALPVFAGDKVEIAFTYPEKFTDIKTEHLDDGSHRAEMLKLLAMAFAGTVSPLVKDACHLSLNFTEIDLAGDYREGPQLGATRVRLVSEHYAPRLAFDFTLTDAAGKVLAKGHRDITDHSFLDTASTSDRDAFKYENQILRQWARKELRR